MSGTGFGLFALFRPGVLPAGLRAGEGGHAGAGGPAGVAAAASMPRPWLIVLSAACLGVGLALYLLPMAGEDERLDGDADAPGRPASSRGQIQQVVLDDPAARMRQPESGSAGAGDHERVPGAARHPAGQSADPAAVLTQSRQLDADTVRWALIRELRPFTKLLSVRERAGRFDIHFAYDQPVAWEGLPYLTALAMEATRLGSVLAAEKVPLGQFSIAGSLLQVDKDGNEHWQKIIAVEIPGQTHENSTWASLKPWDFYDIGKVYLPEEGRQAAAGFCADALVAMQKTAFCPAALAGRISSVWPWPASGTGAGEASGRPLPGWLAKHLADFPVQAFLDRPLAGNLGVDWPAYAERVNSHFSENGFPASLPVRHKWPTAPGHRAAQPEPLQIKEGLLLRLLLDAESRKVSRLLVEVSAKEDMEIQLYNQQAALLMASVLQQGKAAGAVGEALSAMAMSTASKQAISGKVEQDSFEKNGIRYGLFLAADGQMWLYAEPAALP